MKQVAIGSKNVIGKKKDLRGIRAIEIGWRRMLGFRGVIIALAVWLVLLAGCDHGEGDRVRDLDGIIVSEEALPMELKEIIDGKKEQAFQLTYSDGDYLYICIGYGKQDTGGYSIALNDLYLTETEVRVDTTLLGPELADQKKKTATYPYLVIRTELVEQPVVFK